VRNLRWKIATELLGAIFPVLMAVCITFIATRLLYTLVTLILGE